LLPLHLVSSQMERHGQLSVQVTKSRNCVSPLCTANDKKINTGNDQSQLQAIRSPSLSLSHTHTHTNTHCAADYNMLCMCTVHAAAVTRREVWRGRESETDRKSEASSFMVWSVVKAGEKSSDCTLFAKLEVIRLKRWG